jgi:hypothetical protein
MNIGSVNHPAIKEHFLRIVRELYKDYLATLEK